MPLPPQTFFQVTYPSPCLQPNTTMPDDTDQGCLEKVTAGCSPLTDILDDIPRPCALIKLPNEMLEHIFDYFKDPRVDISGRINSVKIDKPTRLTNRKAITNARMTCRFLYSFTTSYVQPTIVEVGLDMESLEKLDAISRIPSIANGLLGIQVNLSYRPELIAGSMALFSQHSTTSALKRSSYRKMEGLGLPTNPATDPILQDASAKVDEVLQACFYEYKRLHAEEQRILNRGLLEKAVVAAMSRMPLCRTLLLTDETNHIDDNDTTPRQQDELQRAAVATSSWSEIEETYRWSSDPPSSVLSDLPIAIQRGG